MLVKIALALLLGTVSAHAGETFRGLTPQNQAPACTDTLLTIPSSGADYRTSAGCPTVVKLSQYGIASDTSGLETIAPTAGSDQTTAIQAVFDLNKISGTPLVIIDDVKATISALTINSHTSVVCTPGSGFLLKVGGPGPILRNSVKSWGTPTATPYYRTVGSFGNTDISIGDGCVFNEQRANQALSTAPNQTLYTNGMPAAIQMFGVQNLNIGAVKIYSSIWFSIIVANVQHFSLGHAVIDASPLAAGGVGGMPGVGTDCVHINGPATDIALASYNCHSGDDHVAISADDGQGGAAIEQSCGNGSDWNPCVGDITDWHVYGIVLDNGIDGTVGRDGVAIFSAYSLVDNGVIEGIVGQTTDNSFHFWAGGSGAGVTPPIAGPGNIGHVVVHGPGPSVVGGAPYGGFLGEINLDAVANVISLYDFARTSPTQAIPFIYVNANIDEIQITNLVGSTTSASYAEPLIQVAAGVGELSITHASSTSGASPPPCNPVVAVTAATSETTGYVVRLHASGINLNGNQCGFTVASGGTIAFGRWDGSMTATGGSYAPLANAGTVGYWWDNSAAFNAVSGEGYTGTAPTHYNSGAPTTSP